MPKLTHQLPKYSRHSATGRAMVRLNKKAIYLGPYGSRESRERYDQIIGLWLANGRKLDAPGQLLPPASGATPPQAADAGGGNATGSATIGAMVDGLPAHQYGGIEPAAAPASMTIMELMLAYLSHAAEYYQKDGLATGEIPSIKSAMKPLKKLFGWTAAAAFDSLALEKLRDAYIDAGQARTTVNQNIGRIKRMFKWAGKKKHVPAAVYHELQTVEGLKFGRCKARETEPVKPVCWDLVAPLEAFVAPPVWAMIRLQWLTGMRSGEVVIMRGRDIEMTGDVWLYRPSTHKTAHHGHAKIIDLGPQAQDIIRKFLKPDVDAYLFDPPAGQGVRGGNKYRRKKKAGKSGRRLGARYDADSHRRAVTRGIEKAFPPPPALAAEDDETKEQTMKRLGPRRWAQRQEWIKVHHWHPHQLRHSAGTRIRKEAGLEAARAVLGHTTMRMTELYAEMDRDTVRAVVKKMG